MRETVEGLCREHEPEVIGLSVMTFQRRTAKRLIALLRASCPEAPIVVGGYDPSLAPEAWTDGSADVIVRGEGEIAFRELLRAFESSASLGTVPGITYRDGQTLPEDPRPARHRHRERRDSPSRTGRPRALRLHPPGPAGGRGRDLAWLHLRLQLLLDHRDARSQLPHLLLRPRASPTSRTRATTAPGPSSWWTTTSP